MQPLNTNDPFTALSSLVNQGYKMPEFNSNQFASPMGPQFSGSNSPFGGSLSQGGPSFGGRNSGGGGMGQALQSAAAQIVASNQQLIQALNKVATALTGSGAPGGAPGEQPGTPRGPQGLMARQRAKFTRRFGSGMLAKRGLGMAAQFGARMATGAMAVQGRLNEMGGFETQLGILERDVDMEMQLSRQYATMADTSQGNIIGTRVGGMVSSANLGAGGVGSTFQSIRSQQAVGNFLTSGKANLVRQRAEASFTGSSQQATLFNRIAQEEDMTGGTLKQLGVKFLTSAFSFADFQGFGDSQEALFKAGKKVRARMETERQNFGQKIGSQKVAERTAEEAEKGRKAGELEDIAVAAAARSGGLRSATTLEGRMSVRAAFPSFDPGTSAVKKAQLRAGYSRRAAQLGTLKGVSTNILGFENAMFGFQNIVDENFVGTGVGGAMTNSQLKGMIGGPNNAMTSIFGVMGDSLGLDSLQAMKMFGGMAAAQGFRGFDITRVQGKMNGQTSMTDGPDGVSRNLRGQTAVQNLRNRGANTITDMADIEAFLQTGMSQQTIGAALSLNRGGSGARGMFGGNTGTAVLAQLNASGLRGAGAAEYIAGVNTIAAQSVQRGQTLKPGELGGDVGSLVMSGRALGGGLGEHFQNAAGLQRYASMVGKSNVSSAFSGLFAGVGSQLIQMEALEQAKGDLYEGFRISSNMTLKNKRDAIFKRVKGSQNRRNTIMGMGFTVPEVEAMMTMSDGELPATKALLQERLKGQTLQATKAETMTKDTKVAAENYGLAKQIEISEQVLRENMLQNVKLEKLIKILSQERVGGGTAADRAKAEREAGK